MQKSNKHPDGSEDETYTTDSDNSIEYIKYIKKLELQRSVLNKIVNSDLNIISSTSTIEPDNNESV